MRQTLDKYPKLNATRLHHMVRERGYTGGVDHFRDVVRRMRPKPAGEAFLRLSTLPGEQGQVDWGHFGKLQVGNAERRLLAFVMVLSWSRRIFLRFYLNDDTASFLHAHIAAFEHFERVPRELLYDNLKTAVLERVDSAIRFNPELLKLAAHYRFAAKPVPVARPTSKGRVERAIQYVRSAFFAAREFESLDDLNTQALQWCQDEAATRSCPDNKNMTVSEAFEAERESMLELPVTIYSVFDRKAVSIGKWPYARFDGNDYSVPHTHVRRTLLIEATHDVVRIVDGIDVVAEHIRSFDKGTQIEIKEHISRLEAAKKNASRHRGMNRLLNVVPSSKEFFRLAAQRGHNMGRLTQLLVSLLELYGSDELETALSECILNGPIHSEAVRNKLEARRAARGMKPAIPLRFLKDRRIDEVVVKPKPLNVYDKLLRMEDD